MLRTIGKGLAAIVAAVVLPAALAILWPSATAPLPDARRGHPIDNVRVVDVEAGRAGGPTSVEVRDGRITAIGGAASADLVRVDGRGGFLVPGFWDMHMHSFQLSPQM